MALTHRQLAFCLLLILPCTSPWAASFGARQLNSALVAAAALRDDGFEGKSTTVVAAIMLEDRKMNPRLGEDQLLARARGVERSLRGVQSVPTSRWSLDRVWNRVRRDARTPGRASATRPSPTGPAPTLSVIERCIAVYSRQKQESGRPAWVDDLDRLTFQTADAGLLGEPGDERYATAVWRGLARAAHDDPTLKAAANRALSPRLGLTLDGDLRSNLGKLSLPDPFAATLVELSDPAPPAAGIDRLRHEVDVQIDRAAAVTDAALRRLMPGGPIDGAADHPRTEIGLSRVTWSPDAGSDPRESLERRRHVEILSQVRDTTRLIAMVLEDLGDERSARRASVVGGSIVFVADEVSKLATGVEPDESPDGEGAADVAAGIAAAAAWIVDLFRGGVPREQRTLDDLRRLALNIDRLRRAMRPRWSRIDLNLDRLYQGMDDQFSALLPTRLPADGETGATLQNADSIEHGLRSVAVLARRTRMEIRDQLTAPDGTGLLESLHDTYGDGSGSSTGPSMPTLVRSAGVLPAFATVHAGDSLRAGPRARRYTNDEAAGSLEFPLEEGINYAFDFLQVGALQLQNPTFNAGPRSATLIFAGTQNVVGTASGEVARLTFHIPASAAANQVFATRIAQSIANDVTHKFPTLGKDGSVTVVKVGKGDVSGDGSIDPFDVTLMLRYIAGLITLQPQQISAADIDCSGTVANPDVTPFDATLLLRYIAGIIKALPCQ